MINKISLFVLVIVAALSCDKDGADGDYIVSAKKMISITSTDWSSSEPQLRNITGYKYTKSPDNLSAIIKAEVALPAVDDSNRSVKGSVLLNIAPDNHVFFAGFNTDPVAKSVAYAMLLQYNNETLRTVTEFLLLLESI